MSRRKTLLANELPTFIDDEVDEAEEKRQQHQRRVSDFHSDKNDSERQQQRKKHIASRIAHDSPQTTRNGAGTAIATDPLPKPSNEQLSCLYNNCVKLLNENKINSKNAFQLKLIDYMTDIVLNKNIVGGVTNFQVVGCTIDAGTKIYAARVDALHHNTYQMLSGLGHSERDAEQGDDNFSNDNQNEMRNNSDNSDNEDGNEQGNKKNKKQRRRVKKSSQIAENLDTITSKVFDDFIEADLYFSKISTCIENEGIGGILLNKLNFIDDSLRMFINVDDKCSLNEQIPEIETDQNENNFKDICDSYKSHDWSNIQLCTDFTTFKFIGWNMDANDEISKLVESMAVEEDEDLERHRFDANNLQVSQLNMSKIGFPSSQADVDFESNYNDMDGPDGSINGDGPGGPIEMLDNIDDIRSLNSIAELTTLVANSPSDYSYFNLDKLKMHDLPKHLKRFASSLIDRRGAERNPDGSTVDPDNQSGLLVQRNAVTARPKREPPRIDFSIVMDSKALNKITRKAIYLCDKTIDKRSLNPIRLEKECECPYNSKDLFHPWIIVVPARIMTENFDGNLLIDDEQNRRPIENHNNDDDDDIAVGDFEIPCTAQSVEPFYTQNGGEFVQTQGTDLNGMLGFGDNGDIMGTEGMINGDMEQMKFEGDFLVQAPMQVNALNIEYARTSKSIDVRRLKYIIWNLLCSDNEKVILLFFSFELFLFYHIV
jgi:condensin complex subunit 2